MKIRIKVGNQVEERNESIAAEINSTIAELEARVARKEIDSYEISFE